MATPEHLNKAVARLDSAAKRIEAVQAKPSTPDQMREWLEALTDFSAALSDIQIYTNESVHEKLHQLADHVELTKFRPL